MEIVRIIGAIVTGYLVFALASMLLVGLVMAQQGPLIAALALVGLPLIGLAAGFTARAIAGEKRRLAAYILAGLVLLATLVNLILAAGAERIWYKVGTLLLTVPLILVVGIRQPRA